LGLNLVWVAGVVAALIGLMQVAAGALVGPLTKLVPRRSVCLLMLTGVMAVSSVGAGIVGLVTRTPASFYMAVALYLVSVLGFGLSGPIKQAWLNACIPSEQRATIISFDALFGDGGGTFGQVGLGYMSRAISIPVAWVLGSAVQALAMPLFLVAGRKSPEADRGEPCVGMVHEGGVVGADVEAAV
jgi:MFS family permease